MLGVFRLVDIWELAVLAVHRGSNRLSQFCYCQPLKLSGCREKEEKHFSRTWMVDRRPNSLSRGSPRCVAYLNVGYVHLVCYDPFDEREMERGAYG